ncbi:hypothetical protein TOPH_01901 [Tolypocladium ophioglossoides CBS 100239]|uniref:Autophagy-related protein 28 n=1 Tax=Tolypocladium ophioglossoides (strain CBS 100239) TaxID=1163406 RepID=A0A0L0NIF2_TOLOC|nr:hypothetical protein TOPH_01901 [Tolypocladium ophioglossoides CBS 100239]
MLDRFTSAAHRSSFLSPRSKRSPSEYQLDQLEPRPDDAVSLDHHLPRSRLRRPAALGTSPRDMSPGSWNGRPSSAGSSSRLRQPPAMFLGPPPPIAASMVIGSSSSPPRSNHSHEGVSHSLLGASRANISSVLFDQRQEFASQSSDSAWRALRRREQALEQDVQQLLDFQAAGLVAGSAGGLDVGSSSDLDGHSDAGSSTPTGTFYSTASSRSRMPKSLYLPPQSTPEGNVIPVRQPTRERPMGLRAARKGLRKSMMALVDLKREEDAHLDAALAERKMALARLNRLGTRRSGIQDELMALEGDGEEPLGKELRDLGSKHDTLDREIRLLEEKLVGMRNRRRWLRENMDEVKSKREAGLSGYRGALKDVDVEVSALVRRPPVLPLDQEMVSQGSGPDAEPCSTGGVEFMRLIPERRTVEMAKAWWEAEIGILERRKDQIDQEQQALEEGSATWQEVMALVSDFESNLRGIVKAGTDASAPLSAKGKEKAPSAEDMIRSQLPKMDEVVTELEQRMQLAESKRWNLLICAIGAELEAFKEAHDMLRGIVDGADGADEDSRGDSRTEEKLVDDDVTSNGGPGRDESDNEVPPDLLVSRLDDADRESAISRQDSENEVPPEFLAEHGHDKDI